MAMDTTIAIPRMELLQVADAVAREKSIDRPLTRLADFERFAGHEAAVELTEPVEGQRRFKGRLLGVSGEEVRIAGAEREIKLPARKIRRAKLVLTDELLAAESVKAGRARE